MEDTRLTYASPDDPAWKRALVDGLERLSGRHGIERLCMEVLDDPMPMEEKWAETVRRLRITVRRDASALERVPKDGPLVVIANHPFGVIDGLILLDILATLRDGYFVLVNSLLCRDPRLDPYLLPIDFEETRDAVRTNIRTRREAMERLRRGEALGIFPAGGVATAQGGFGHARELEWKRFVAKLIRTTRATVLPLFFEGQNSRAFHIVSQYSLTLRLAMLLHEVRNKRGQTLHVRTGEPLPYSVLEDIPPAGLVPHLHRITHALGGVEDTTPFQSRLW